MKNTITRLLKFFLCWILMLASAITVTFAGQRDFVALVWAAVLLYITGGLMFACAVEYLFPVSIVPLPFAGSIGAALFMLLIAQFPTGPLAYSGALDTALSILAVLTYTAVWGAIAEFLVKLARWRWSKQ